MKRSVRKGISLFRSTPLETLSWLECTVEIRWASVGRLLTRFALRRRTPAAISIGMNQVRQHVIRSGYDIPSQLSPPGWWQRAPRLEVLLPRRIADSDCFRHAISREQRNDNAGSASFHHSTKCQRYGASAYFCLLEYNQPAASGCSQARWIEGH